MKRHLHEMQTHETKTNIKRRNEYEMSRGETNTKYQETKLKRNVERRH